LELDLALCLTVCLEGRDEKLVCEVVVIEREASVGQLDWPREMDARDVNYTVLSHVRGSLLPRHWPQEYDPYRNVPGGQESLIATDTSIIQSNLIECWSMSWWGFQKGASALILIVETADDAAYTFSHPAGGPTVIGPRWLASLGRLRYPRSVSWIAALLEMANHEFLDRNRRKERSTFADGTTVTIDRDARTFEIRPELGL
jgi:hypothetical protein